MNQKHKDWAVRIGFNIVYALLASALFSFGLIMVGRQFVSPRVGLDALIQINFAGFFGLAFLFLFPLFMIFSSFSSGKQVTHESEFLLKVESKLRNMSLEKRQQAATFLKRCSIGLIFLIFILILLIGQESYLNPSYKSPLTNWFLVIYFAIYASLILNKFLMRRSDWAIYHLQNFKETEECQDLERALKSYDKILGSTLSYKNIIAVSQYVKEAFKIGNAEEVKDLDIRIDEILENLKAKDVSKTDDNLITLSKTAKEITKDHETVFGFEPKYPYRILISEKLRSSSDKVFPQIMILMVWIGFILILARFGVINISLPP